MERKSGGTPTRLRWDIGPRVLLAALLPAALMAIAIAWSLTASRLADLQSALTNQGLAAVRLLAPAAEFGVFSGNEDILRQLTDAAARESDVSGVVIFDATGRVLAQSGRPLHVPTDLPISATLVASSGDTLRFAAPIGQLQTRLEEVFQTGAAPPTPIGSAVIELSTRGLADRRADLVRNTALITMLGLLAAGYLAHLLSRGVTGPVLGLARLVGAIGGGELATRTQVTARGSLGILQVGVNDMAASLGDARATLEARIVAATAQLQAAKERAEEANRTKTQFLTAASHDLRQPLQAIGLLSAALARQTHDADSMQIIARIDQAVEGLESVLEGLLDISRLDAGVVEPRLSIFPLRKLFQNIEATFSASADARGLRLRFGPTDVLIASDRLLLERILSNLVANAIRYTRTGGIVIGARRRGAQVMIEVWDSGVGIPASHLTDVFQEFVRLESSAVQGDRGLGLGLAIVERLANLLKHPITVRSQVGRGSRFSITVPRIDAMPASRLDDHCVLVVDDDAMILAALHATLTAAGARVLLADGHSSALAQARATAPLHAIVCDYRLGEYDSGLGVIRSIIAAVGPRPAIILSGETHDAALADIAASGFIYLAKPAGAEALCAAIVRACRSSPLSD
jgi:two-component system, sensor histidine kinase